MTIAISSGRADGGYFVSLSAGSAVFHDDGWRPQRSLSPIGVVMDLRPQGWPVDLEIRFHHERTREQNTVALPVGHVATDLTLQSLSAGIIRPFRTGGARPFLGGGVEALYYRRYLFDNDFGADGRIRDGGVAGGLYGNGGILWHAGKGFAVGFEARFFAGTPVTLTAVEVTPGVSFRLEEREESTLRREIAVLFGWGRDRR